MALQTGQFGVLFEVQSADGTLASGLQTLYDTPPGSVDSDDGAVFGDSASGVGESGIDLTLGRNARDAARVTGGDTRQFDEFLNGTVETFSFSWPISGPKSDTTGSPVDGDFQHLPVGVGIGALLRSAGLGQGAADGSGVGWVYDGEAPERISALVFDSGSVYAIIDLLATLELDLTPGSTGVYTATLTGKLDPDNPPKEVSFPTFDYGVQASVAAPVISEVGNAFGQTRGFSSLVITIDNLIESTPDSNAIDGTRVDASGRDVSIACTLDVDDTDPDFDVQELLRSVAAGASDMTFQVGTDAVGADPALAYAITLANLNLQDAQLARPARAKAVTFNAFATSDTDGGEFSITFR